MKLHRIIMDADPVWINKKNQGWIYLSYEEQFGTMQTLV
jgi:hypothetical protein